MKEELLCLIVLYFSFLQAKDDNQIFRPLLEDKFLVHGLKMFIGTAGTFPSLKPSKPHAVPRCSQITGLLQTRKFLHKNQCPRTSLHQDNKPHSQLSPLICLGNNNQFFFQLGLEFQNM